MKRSDLADSDFSPLVSIIIPVYNGANFMREAIDSALAQTYENTEIIVVNDGSNDDGETERIALSYGDRIRYFHKPNGGVSTALNLGIREMRGEYFSWLSHDDKYDADKVRTQVEQLAKYPENKKLVSLGDCRHINESSEEIPGYCRKSISDGEVLEPKAVLKKLFQTGSFAGCALLIPRSAFDIAGGFDERLRFSQDYLMWIKIFLNDFSLIYCDDSKTYNRVHAKQLTKTGQDIFHKDSEKLCDAVLPDIARISTADDDLLFEFALNNAKYNNLYAVDSCRRAAKERHLFNALQKCKLTAFCLYGKVRPAIRELYYKIIR